MKISRQPSAVSRQPSAVSRQPAQRKHLCFRAFYALILLFPLLGWTLPSLADEVAVSFSPRDDALSHVLLELQHAHRSIDAALFYLSHPQLIDALCRIAAEGRVRVRLLTDVEATRPADRHILEQLIRNGVDVRTLTIPGGKMHMKCALLDSTTVLTGAANWTTEAFDHNIEDSVVLKSTGIAQRYQSHFEQLFSNATPLVASTGQIPEIARGVHQNIVQFPSAVDPSLPAAPLPAEVFFSPGREGPRRLGEQIIMATNSVTVAMYLLNDSAMRQALAEKARRGDVPVRLLVDAGMLDGALRPVLQELAEAGAEVMWWGAERGILHLKTAVIDRRYVWTGSANWTPNALDRNAEDMLLMDSTNVAAMYLELLHSLWSQAKVFRPAGRLSAEIMQDSCTMRDGFAVGLPPTGARTNWNNVLDKKSFPSFDSRAVLQYLPDDQYYPALLKLIQEARQSVLIAMFVFTPPKDKEPLKDRLVKTLVEAAQQGVYVRLVLDLSAGEGDSLAQAHEEWAEVLRKQGVDVRLSIPTVSLHAKLVVVDLANVLIGSHNWTEGALSGERIYESTVLLTLPHQDRRWADYVFNLETVSDMRSREHWQEELRQMRQLSGLRGKSQSKYLQELESSQ